MVLKLLSFNFCLLIWCWSLLELASRFDYSGSDCICGCNDASMQFFVLIMMLIFTETRLTFRLQFILYVVDLMVFVVVMMLSCNIVLMMLNYCFWYIVDVVVFWVCDDVLVNMMPSYICTSDFDPIRPKYFRVWWYFG